MLPRHRKMRLTSAHVALLPARIDDPGPMRLEGEKPLPEDYYEATTATLIGALAPGEDMWLFACGSLIWNRRFTSDDERPGIVRGWHRAFCLGPDTRFRGSPQAPGYMLSLDRGGQCKGMVYRLPRAGLAANLANLLRREPPFPPRWVHAATPLGPVRAIAFTHPGRRIGYTGHLDDEQIADALARAVGMVGSMAEYLYLTARHLEELGLCDARVWRMQDMVAERIERAFPGRIGATAGNDRTAAPAVLDLGAG